ncbi:MAG: hypothetical protein WBM06_08120 [Pseudolabrys sp.]
MVRPARSTTATETLKPMLSHWATAAWAIVCAIASGMFFWVTSPCAVAVDDSAAITAKAADIFDIAGMSVPSFRF